MKRIFAFIVVFQVCLVTLIAQSANLPPLDKSPADISYFPNNYPALKVQNKMTDPLVARIIYSRPKKENRVIFGGLVEYGSVWRLGANEATEIEFFKNVKVNGKKIGKGRYTLYAIVGENSWTFIINKETDTWGSFKYDPKKDLIRIDAPVQRSTEIVESLAMVFEKTVSGMNLIVAWDNVKVAMPFNL